MNWSVAVSLAGAVILLVACEGRGTMEPAPKEEGSLRDELAAIARLRIFFGHQSVGSDILSGLQSLSAREDFSLRIAAVASAGGVEAGTLGHTAISRNGAPLEKLESFAAAFDGVQSAPDVAFMKFCYVDFSESTDPVGLFARYRETIAHLQARHPSTKFVHVTVPLTAEEPWPKRWMKRILGRATAFTLNAVRERYNDELRRTFGGREPIFDLARIESTDSAGRPVLIGAGAGAVHMLAPEYTEDGAHLAAVGQVTVARSLVGFLAGLGVSPEVDLSKVEVR